MVYEGHYVVKNFNIAIVVSRFNEFITDKLLKGAMECYVKHGGKKDQIDIVYTPGSFEIPILLKNLSAKKKESKPKYDGLIAIGCVIKGETSHYDHVANLSAQGVLSTALKENIPISFGILTTENTQQAMDRAGIKLGNKGWEACLSLLETINVIRSLDQSS